MPAIKTSTKTSSKKSSNKKPQANAQKTAVKSDFPALSTKNVSVAVSSVAAVINAPVTRVFNTTTMLERLRKAAVPEYSTVESIAKSLRVTVDSIGKLPEMAKSWPYFRADNVAQFFDLSDDIDACLFDQTEMLILNDSGVKSMFFSIPGIYKLLLLSDFSESTKLRLIEEYRTPGYPGEWFVPKLVPNKSKYPLLILNTFRNETHFERHVKHNANDQYPISQVARLMFKIGAPKKFSHLECGTPSEVQLTNGCVQEKWSNDIFKFGTNSPNLTLKKGDKVVKLTKKFKPIIKQKSYTYDEMIALLCVSAPRNFVRMIVNDSKHVHDLQVTYTHSDNMAGFLYLSPEGQLTIGDNVDNSVSFSVACACRVTDIICAKKLIDAKWTFDEIISHIACA